MHTHLSLTHTCVPHTHTHTLTHTTQNDSVLSEEDNSCYRDYHYSGLAVCLGLQFCLCLSTEEYLKIQTGAGAKEVTNVLYTGTWQHRSGENPVIFDSTRQ